jgi:GPH family glycoside/pentoside/hexuronide:cation symporter
MTLKEKIGYGFGDMASSMFWKLISYFLPFFYTNVFGLGLDTAAFLMLITRIWDAVSDPMMGIIADRTNTRWGKYRPYLLFFAVPFSVAGVLLFTTPDSSEGFKTFWAYFTYILMMTVYTGINVPYGAMLNTMTTDSDQKSVLSSYRMFFAYAGSFVALFAWEPLCNTFAPEVKLDESVAKIEISSQGKLMVFDVHKDVLDFYQVEDSLDAKNAEEIKAADLVLALNSYSNKEVTADSVYNYLKDIKEEHVENINKELASAELPAIKMVQMDESFKNISLEPAAWRNAMIVIAIVACALFLLCFTMTREHVKSESKVSVGSDFKLLLKNKPWWLLIGAALGSNLFNTVRGTATAYFFADYLTQLVHIDSSMAFLLSASIFLSFGEIANMIGVVLAVPMSRKLGKKSTYIFSMAALIGLSILFFFLPATSGGYLAMLFFQIVISIFTGVVSPLIWSMYADVADYSECKDGTSSTGLIFSSASMAQKFGSAFGGAAVMWILAGFGYDTTAGAVQTETAILGLQMLMSWVPAIVAVLSILVVWFYPLTKKKMEDVQAELAAKRADR